MKILPIPLAIVLVVTADCAFHADAQTVTILHSFVGSADGNVPYAGLIQGSDGNFYGTTYQGGTNGLSPGFGTVFQISPSGTYTSLYSFESQPNDGQNPFAGLVQGIDGNLYGTTYYGGTSTNCVGGCGTVFQISPSGTYTSLYSFTGSPTDGSLAFGALVQGSDGNFYGTTEGGGTNGYGTVFRISPSGSETNLYSFVGTPTDGSGPLGGLVLGSDGNFYGTTVNGGTNHNGTVFRISPSGTYTSLYFFGNSPDGATPEGGVVQGSDGNFYGTAYQGGTYSNGTVFRISPSGNETNLYSFAGNHASPTDGEYPGAGLVQGSDGKFYGTAQGGINGGGTVFRISPSGTYTSLYSFGSQSNDGYSPEDSLVQGSDGNFYGTTTQGGGRLSVGTVFKLIVSLNPPANQISGIEFAGTNILFNIPSIAGETYQLQFSCSMNPANWVDIPGVSITNSIGSILTLTNYAGANQPQGFYRFAITP